MNFIIANATRILQTKKHLKEPKKKLNKAISLATPPASKPKWGRPSLTNLPVEKDESVIQSQSVAYEKIQCICQKTGRQLLKVETKETDRKMLEVSQKLSKGGIGD